MQLTRKQLQKYDEDGFLILPGLIRPEEVAALSAEVDRLKTIKASPCIKFERNGNIRMILRMHEQEGDTASPEMRALSRLPRLLGPAKQMLRDRDVYVYHTKLNLKPAFEGTIWAWHQDFGTWKRDGVVDPNIVTALVMLDQAEEMGGALYFVPGSHRLGSLEHIEDEGVGALNKNSVRRDLLAQCMEARKPVPLVGPPGTVAIFHSNVVHGSGHNMSSRDRRQMYVVYNPVTNKPEAVTDPRPDQLCSLNQIPIDMVSDDAILAAAAAHNELVVN